VTMLERFLTVAICVAATQFTRFLPFLVFSEKKDPPGLVVYLGKALPPALFAMLTVYSLRHVSLAVRPYGLPELLGLLITGLLYFWKRQILLPIAGGTIAYMLMIRLIF
jgi:branched-subunit amino acid transport protein AzlD